MPMRPFKLPDDIPILIDVLPPSFQYPENDAWSIQADEAESLADSLNGLRRLWPVLRVLQVVYAPLRDVMRGFIWEEDGRAVGVSNVLREGDTNQWAIGNVSVLPDYRRRGIARELVAASVDYARRRGADRITLRVVDGNLPAIKLYESLGFTCFSAESELACAPDVAVTVERVPLPDDYTLQAAGLFNWQPAYELAQRITPDAVQRYHPVEEGTFRKPGILRPLTPLLFRAIGSRPHGTDVRRRADGQVVARSMCNARLRAGGANNITLTLDPAHGAIAPALVAYALDQTAALAPGRRTELSVPHWQRSTLQAAKAAGFEERCATLSMGIVV
jgi:GNAT superfamily N-acetyltransferase